MYICNECESLIVRLSVIRDYHTELESEPYEEYEVCPYCHSDDVEEADYCTECDRPICTATKYINDKMKALCEECYNREEERERIAEIRRRRNMFKYGNAIRIDGRTYEPA